MLRSTGSELHIVKLGLTGQGSARVGEGMCVPVSGCEYSVLVYRGGRRGFPEGGVETQLLSL